MHVMPCLQRPQLYLPLLTLTLTLLLLLTRRGRFVPNAKSPVKT